MATQALVGSFEGVFQDALGNPLRLGYLRIRLNIDAVSEDNTQLAAGRVVTVQLDDTGAIDPTAQIWPNDQLTPSGTVYIVKAYSASGQRVWEQEMSIPTAVN